MQIKNGCLILSLTLAVIGCSKKQEIIFQAESISYRSGSRKETQKECQEISKEINTYLDDGWRIIASSPKEKMVANDNGKCIGTEYILEK